MSACIVQVGKVRRVRILNQATLQVVKVRRVGILKIYNLWKTQELTELGWEDYDENHKYQHSKGWKVGVQVEKVRRDRILRMYKLSQAQDSIEFDWGDYDENHKGPYSRKEGARVGILNLITQRLRIHWNGCKWRRFEVWEFEDAIAWMFVLVK